MRDITSLDFRKTISSFLQQFDRAHWRLFVLTELHGKEVVVHLGIVAALTDSVSGKIVATNDQWIQVKTKKQLEFIAIASVKRIVVVG